MITNETLEEKGYMNITFENVPDWLQRHATKVYQRKIKDEKGIKYFITIYFYDWEFSQYEFEIYSYTQSGTAIQMLLYGIHEKTLAQVEEEIDDIFNKCNFKYYEVEKDENV